MLKIVKTKYVTNYDTDVIFDVNNYVLAVKILNQGINFVYPYSGEFWEIRNDITRCSTIENINLNNYKIEMLNHQSYGGAVFFNTEDYKQGGGENENFYVWGFEDLERRYRFLTLGYKFGRVSGDCYHIQHPRIGINSNPSNPNYAKSQAEWEKISIMNKRQLEQYISAWKWVKNF